MDWLPDATKDHVKTGGTFAERTDPKGVLHTTESFSWPTYSGWTIPPHVTIKPIPGVGVVVRQHVSFAESAFALRNLDGGVQTNRDYAFQFELIGTCDPATAKNFGYYFWPNADDEVLIDLFKKVILPVSVAFNIPLQSLPFKAYPSSYGTGNTVRLSGNQWDNYTGWCGHQHVPENVHGDPGLFPWDRMMELIVAITEQDIKDIWRADIVPAPGLPADPTNPTWAPQSVLTYLGNQSIRALTEISTVKADLAAANAALDELRAALPGIIAAAVADAVTKNVVRVAVSVNGNQVQ